MFSQKLELEFPELAGNFFAPYRSGSSCVVSLCELLGYHRVITLPQQLKVSRVIVSMRKTEVKMLFMT